jgi:hypothetical protein
MKVFFRSRWFLLILGGAAALAVWAAALLFSGNRRVVVRFLDWFVPAAEITVNEVEGDIFRGLIFRNIHFQNLVDMPEGSELKIQELTVNGHGLDWKAADLEIRNARLFLPGQDLIVIDGRYSDRQLDMNIYANGAFLSTLVGLWPDWEIRLPDPASLEAIDIYLRGAVDEPQITGQFMVRRAVFQKFQLDGAPVIFDLRIDRRHREWGVTGFVEIGRGDFYSPYSDLRLSLSRLEFEGDWSNPRLDIHAWAEIERVKTVLKVRGTIERPEIELSSEPPLPQEELMLMVATGKRWRGLTTLMENGAVNADLTKDFIDYVFLAGRGSRFARRYGIYDMSITLERDRQGISARKILSDRLDVGYAIEKEQELEAGRDQVRQKVEGALRLTEGISVGVERDIETTFQDRQAQEPARIEDRFMLWFKRRF